MLLIIFDGTAAKNVWKQFSKRYIYLTNIRISLLSLLLFSCFSMSTTQWFCNFVVNLDSKYYYNNRENINLLL